MWGRDICIIYTIYIDIIKEKPQMKNAKKYILVKNHFSILIKVGEYGYLIEYVMFIDF